MAATQNPNHRISIFEISNNLSASIHQSDIFPPRYLSLAIIVHTMFRPQLPSSGSITIVRIPCIHIRVSFYRCRLSPLLVLWSRTCCSKSSIIIRWCSRLLPKSRPCADIQIPLYIVHSLESGYQSLNLTICPFACVVSGNSKTRRSMISRVNFFSTYDSQCDQHDSDRRCKHCERKG